MRTALVLFFMVATCGLSSAGELTPGQIKGELLFQALNAADIGLTVRAMDDPNIKEINPILGEHPSSSELLLFGASVGLLHYGITRYLLKEPKNRKTWLWISNIVKIAVVGNNIVVIEW